MLETMTVHAGRSPLTPERARQLLLAREAEAGLARVVRRAASILASPIATLGIKDEELLRIAAGQGVPHPWSAAGAVPLACVPCSYTLYLPEPLVIDDLEQHPLGRELWLEAFPRRAYLGTGVRVRGEVVAALCVSDLSPRRWSAEDVKLLHDAAANVVRELEQLVGGEAEAEGPVPPPILTLLRGSGEREPEEDPRDREAQWRALLDETGIGVFVLDREGRLVEHNRALLRIFDCPEEADALAVRDHVARASDLVRLERELEQHGSLTEHEIELRRRDGGTVQCMVSLVVRRGADGEVLGYRGVLRDVSEQRAAERKLVESAFHDALTGLPNRALLLDRLERLLRHSKRHAGYRFGVLFIDLDRFKAVNDTHGHQVGDRLLERVARRLERCVRQEDTVARIGGDEFAILLDGIVDADGVVQVTERILHELAQPYDGPVPLDGIGASIGIALSMTGYETVDEVLRDADSAMYRAKSAGRNGFAVFDTDMYGRMRAQLKLEAELREAVRGNQLVLQYHPVVALEGGAVTGMEALLRWTHPERGVLLPDEFMPLAERTGLIVDIGWWVFREACRQLHAWQLEYPQSALRLTMNVNLSARQFMQPDLVQRIDRIVAETGVDPSCLRLDVKEAAVMTDPELASRLIAEIGQRGIGICIDDFGTGYSSLQALRELPISGLKIAPHFVRELSDGGSRSVVQTIIALGRSMAIEAIAEGVETPEQLEQLRNLGTRFAQGFLFSLPLDAERARALLAP